MAVWALESERERLRISGYACLKGVVAAEVVLDHLDELCRQSLPLMAQNGSIFVVNHVSPDAAQHGMLLAAAPHAEEVAATSRALMAKFKAWNADPLSSPQVLLGDAKPHKT